MESNEMVKVVDYIEGYYHRKLEKNEIVLLKEELSCCKSFNEFKEKFAEQLFRKYEFFSIQKLHNIVEDYRQLELLKKSFGIKSLDELYEN